ncbi:AaceriAFR732Cp [[Ashbya] aceris (nom. inval.)]|nr:AaceriAFR732Cp [[Ashbya] aceris (nom. inval.)]
MSAVQLRGQDAVRGHRHKRSFAISGDFDFAGAAGGSSGGRGRVAAAGPRFFISEESRFSAGCGGVPDAIIDLDAALSTQVPGHRRSESAPAEVLERGRLSASPRIEEACGEEEEEPEGRPGLLEVPGAARAHAARRGAPGRDRYDTDGLKMSKQKQRYFSYTRQYSLSQTEVSASPVSSAGSSVSLQNLSTASTPITSAVRSSTPVEVPDSQLELL